MKPLTREALLQKRPRRTITVELPELGGTVIVRELSEGERSRYEGSFLDKEGKPKVSSLDDARRRLIVESVVDADGNKVFTPDDIPAIRDMGASAASRMYNAARDVSGFTDADIEELVKNSSAPPAGNSPSA